jgi:hypothetical protein
MIVLDTTTRKLQLKLAGAKATNDCPSVATYVDVATSTYAPGSNNAVTNGVTAVDIVAAPAVSTQRQVKLLSVQNEDTAEITLSVIYNDNGTQRTMWKGLMSVGDNLLYTDGHGFNLYDSAGQLKTVQGTSSLGLVPVGGIIMWSGTIATIPGDWALCNGTSNAPGPDLRDKFIVGATSDDAGVAKTNIEGALSQSGGATGHSHSGHAALSHSGLSISDHTGLTHGLSIANHPDLTHAALSHPAQTITHPDHSVPSQSHSHAAVTLTHADLSLASFSGSHASQTGSVASETHTHASQAGVASFASGTNRSGLVSKTSLTGSDPSGTFSVASGTHSHAALTITRPAHSVPSFTGTDAALTLTHADHSIASLSHQAIGTHLATDYGVHSITAPPAHGTAGTVTHSFTESSAHSVSAHDSVSQLPNYFALAFIQRMA